MSERAALPNEHTLPARRTLCHRHTYTYLYTKPDLSTADMRNSNVNGYTGSHGHPNLPAWRALQHLYSNLSARHPVRHSIAHVHRYQH